MKHLGVTIIAMGLLGGCARQQQVWTKPNLSQQDFARDKYACVQDSRSQASSGFLSGSYGGSGYLIGGNGGYNNSGGTFGSYHSGEVINNNVFRPCMEAKGYTLTSATSAAAMRTISANLAPAVQQANGCIIEVRQRPQYAELGPHLADVATGAYTVRQLADESFPTPAETQAMIAYLDDTNPCQRVLIQEIAKVSPAIASIRQQSLSAQNDASLLLVQHKVSWGEWAQKLKAIREDAAARMAQVKPT
jgi:hypothetical protein